MIREELWWPDECIEHAVITNVGSDEGTGRSFHTRDYHTFVLKQTRFHFILECVCGRTLERSKP